MSESSPHQSPVDQQTPLRIPCTHEYLCLLPQTLQKHIRCLSAFPVSYHGQDLHNRYAKAEGHPHQTVLHPKQDIFHTPHPNEFQTQKEFWRYMSCP